MPSKAELFHLYLSDPLAEKTTACKCLHEWLKCGRNSESVDVIKFIAENNLYGAMLDYYMSLTKDRSIPYDAHWLLYWCTSHAHGVDSEWKHHLVRTYMEKACHTRNDHSPLEVFHWFVLTYMDEADAKQADEVVLPLSFFEVWEKRLTSTETLSTKERTQVIAVCERYWPRRIALQVYVNAFQLALQLLEGRLVAILKNRLIGQDLAVKEVTLLFPDLFNALSRRVVCWRADAIIATSAMDCIAILLGIKTNAFSFCFCYPHCRKFMERLLHDHCWNSAHLPESLLASIIVALDNAFAQISHREFPSIERTQWMRIIRELHWKHKDAGKDCSTLENILQNLCPAAAPVVSAPVIPAGAASGPPADDDKEEAEKDDEAKAKAAVPVKKAVPAPVVPAGAASGPPPADEDEDEAVTVPAPVAEKAEEAATIPSDTKHSLLNAISSMQKAMTLLQSELEKL